MISEILSALGSIIGGFTANNASNQYNGALEGIKKMQKIPDSALQAKAILAENAGRGLAGYETMKEDINNQLPTTLGAAKDWLTGGGVVDFLSRSQASTNQQLRALNAENEQARQNNLQMYANYLGGPMASQENRLLENQSQIGIAQAVNNADRADTTLNYMNSATGQLGKIGDTDWSNLIALLSKSNNSQADTFGQKYGISSIDRMPSIPSGLVKYIG